MALFDVKSAIAQAKSQTKDMTQTTTGGGEYTPPAEGFVRLRFVGYYEIGKRESEWKGQKRVNDTCELVFELSGPKHAPKETESGEKIPLRITEKVKMSLNENSRFVALFNALNHEKKATHIAELLGNAYVANIKHNKVGSGDKERTYANLENIRAPFVDNMGEDGEVTKKPVNVDPPLTEIKLFVWDIATPEMWDSIFIPGEYEARVKDGKVVSPARSKNVIQQKISEALNWKGSPIYNYAVAKLSGDTAKADATAELANAVGDVASVKQDADDLAEIA